MREQPFFLLFIVRSLRGLTNHPPHRSRGFSIVEVLAVMAIICVLACLAVPAVVNSRRQGYKVACVNALKQLGQAAFLYAQAYDDTVVPASVGRYTGKYKEPLVYWWG